MGMLAFPFPFDEFHKVKCNLFTSPCLGLTFLEWDGKIPMGSEILDVKEHDEGFARRNAKMHARYRQSIGDNRRRSP